jgi:hypothetical protein
MNYRRSTLQLLAMFPLLAGTVFGEPIKTDTAAFTLGEVVVTSEKMQDTSGNILLIK